MKAKTLILGVIATALPAFGMAGNELDMVVGTYTGAGSEGLYSFSFNQATGVARLRSTLEVKNPSYLAFARDGRHLYAVSENNDATAALNSIAFDPVTGNMSYMNSQLTYGKDPCYVDTDGKNGSYGQLLGRQPLRISHSAERNTGKDDDAVYRLQGWSGPFPAGHAAYPLCVLCP